MKEEEWGDEEGNEYEDDRIVRTTRRIELAFKKYMKSNKIIESHKMAAEKKCESPVQL